jgi:hypothetical protein
MCNKTLIGIEPHKFSKWPVQNAFYIIIKLNIESYCNEGFWKIWYLKRAYVFPCLCTNSASAMLDSSGLSVLFVHNHEAAPPPDERNVIDSLTAKLLLVLTHDRILLYDGSRNLQLSLSL